MGTFKKLSAMEIASRLVILFIWLFAEFWFAYGAFYCAKTAYCDSEYIAFGIFVLYTLFVIAMAYPVGKEIVFPKAAPAPDAD